jgi:hypothetical protein
MSCNRIRRSSRVLFLGLATAGVPLSCSGCSTGDALEGSWAAQDGSASFSVDADLSGSGRFVVMSGPASISNVCTVTAINLGEGANPDTTRYQLDVTACSYDADARFTCLLATTEDYLECGGMSGWAAMLVNFYRQ